MQQADSESLVLVCGGGDGGGDRKIACETLADGRGYAPEDLDIPHSTVVEVTPDFPPESFWLSKDAEFDWFDRNAFLERKESTKGNSNSMNLNPNVNPSHSNSNSQRYSMTLKSKPAIIGLPKTQKMTYVESKRRQCKPANIRLFPKRSNSVGKALTTVLVTEPSSPKVSCIGRVRSRRCRSRRKSSAQANQPEKSASQRSGTSRSHKAGFMSRITSLFRSEGHRRKKNGKSSEKVIEPAENSVSRKIYVTVKPVNSEPETPSAPPALGGMMRFASGRRSASWGGSDDEEEVAARHSLDSGRRGL
ncbi:uncharacterized protein LOC111882598 [Lactuca sativa]|uniref:Uncharacterized protein n=1 Tax=Lactuca sativa TaxID=4236 RepID=A0A9R1WW13_LACSA|nr:uncharacterized protein LOC111882598 [Lactuca sativa]KAJ0188664.1 hypothetical protein LSAT_V11C900463520 [Lactuca sativa]